MLEWIKKIWGEIKEKIKEISSMPEEDDVEILILVSLKDQVIGEIQIKKNIPKFKLITQIENLQIQVFDKRERKENV